MSEMDARWHEELLAAKAEIERLTKERKTAFATWLERFGKQERERAEAAAAAMREAAAALAETSKGYPTEVSEAIRALPLPK